MPANSPSVLCGQIGSVLIFGGTTEGRVAVKVLEEAGKTFYYSTKEDTQQVPLEHGVRLTGTMSFEEKVVFCQAHVVRLVIDATHPFAEHIHESIVKLVSTLQLPLIRFERIYPNRHPKVHWVKDYTELMAAIRKQYQGKKPVVVSLCGVSSIASLRDIESVAHMYYRILDRPASYQRALDTGVHSQQLLFSRETDTHDDIQNVHPDVVVIKESGETAGFQQKVDSALQQGCEVYAIRRPEYSRHVETFNLLPDCYQMVNGPHGLRRAVEKLYPGFYDLRSGLTTGTYATAAAVGATCKFLQQSFPMRIQVPVLLPDGETISVPVEYGTDDEGHNYCYCIKDSGDDPDVTNGLEIRVMVEALNVDTENSPDRIAIGGGKGIGTVTLPGFDTPPGSAAINKVPQQMIRQNVRLLTDRPLRITISVPQGEEVARRTFNPRLGIEGGISIVGVSGIIKPFSKQGFLDSIRKCMHVARGTVCRQVVVNSGAKSERYIKEHYPQLPPQVFVEYGNFIGETIQMAAKEGFEKITLGIMLGKAVKLAEGHLDTHSKHSTMNKAFIATLLEEAGCLSAVREALDTMVLARDLWKLIPESHIPLFTQVVKKHCLEHCTPLAPQCEIELLLIDNEGGIW